jgi:hypothetical protein
MLPGFVALRNKSTRLTPQHLSPSYPPGIKWPPFAVFEPGSFRNLRTTVLFNTIEESLPEVRTIKKCCRNHRKRLAISPESPLHKQRLLPRVLRYCICTLPRSDRDLSNSTQRHTNPSSHVDLELVLVFLDIHVFPTIRLVCNIIPGLWGFGGALAPGRALPTLVPFKKRTEIVGLNSLRDILSNHERICSHVSVMIHVLNASLN